MSIHKFCRQTFRHGSGTCCYWLELRRRSPGLSTVGTLAVRVVVSTVLVAVHSHLGIARLFGVAKNARKAAMTIPPVSTGKRKTRFTIVPFHMLQMEVEKSLTTAGRCTVCPAARAGYFTWSRRILHVGYFTGRGGRRTLANLTPFLPINAWNSSPIAIGAKRVLRTIRSYTLADVGVQKKTDVAEHPQVFNHVGLLTNKLPGTAGLLSI